MPILNVLMHLKILCAFIRRQKIKRSKYLHFVIGGTLVFFPSISTFTLSVRIF